MNLFKEEIMKSYLAHGTPWRKHKYVRKEGNRYIYDTSDPEAHKAAVKNAIAEDYHYANNVRTHENNELFKMRDAAAKLDAARKKHIEGGKNYSRQISRRKYQEEEHRKATEPERKRNMKGKRVSREIEQKKREQELSMKFDREAEKRRKKK